MQTNWSKEFPAAITVCNKEGVIIDMNDKAAISFAKDGGYGLIGKNMFECHKDSSNQKIKQIMNEKIPNIYTIEKNGIKKLIYQSPWYNNGEMKGLVEVSLEIPFDLPHFIRE